VQLNGARFWNPHIFKWAVTVALILQACARHCWLFLHSEVTWQTCASAVVEVFMPGQADEALTVWQLVVAVIAFESAKPQQTCPPVQSLAERHMKAALLGPHD
jgi:hypothetical protein